MNRPSIFTWRPATTFMLIGGLVVLLVSLVISYILVNFKPTVPVELGNGVYHLWVANTEADREKGLSGVDSLRPNGGLLMNFGSDDLWGIWMKDMKVPIDIIWLDKDKVVIRIVKDATPELGTTEIFTPKKPARYVIELPAGAVDKAGIKVGKSATFDENSQGGLW